MNREQWRHKRSHTVEVPKGLLVTGELVTGLIQDAKQACGEATSVPGDRLPSHDELTCCDWVTCIPEDKQA